MFHTEDGLFFDRTADGVKIIKTDDGKIPAPNNENVIFEQILPHNSWCSVIASVSKSGESSGRFYKAKEFHDE